MNIYKISKLRREKNIKNIDQFVLLQEYNLIQVMLVCHLYSSIPTKKTYKKVIKFGIFSPLIVFYIPD